VAGELEMTISAVTGDGIRPLVARLATLVSRARAEQPRPSRFALHRPQPSGIVVERSDGGGWVVRGRPAERAVALSDLNNVDALAYAQGRLKSLGVNRSLARAGARAGDLVRIGTFQFDYEPD